MVKPTRPTVANLEMRRQWRSAMSRAHSRPVTDEKSGYAFKVDCEQVTRERRYIRAHGGLRGIAACLVVAYHLQFSDILLPIETATTFFKRGYLWVDLFFILSGFIISYTAWPAGPLLTRAELGQFLRHRVARIYPLHLFCLLYITAFLGAVALMQTVAGRPVMPGRWSAEGMISLSFELALLQAGELGTASPGTFHLGRSARKCSPTSCFQA